MQMRASRLFLSLAFLIATLLTTSPRTLCQTNIDGIAAPQAQTVLPVEHGYIDLSTGSLHLAIPLESYNQRGEVTAAATLLYDSDFWKVINPCDIECYTWQATFYSYPPYSYGGWHISYGDVGTLTNGSVFYVPCEPTSTYPMNPPSIMGVLSEIWKDPQGHSHLFPVNEVSVPDGCTPADGNTYVNSSTTSTYSTDGAGFYLGMTADGQQGIWDRNGTYVYGSEHNPTISDPYNAPVETPFDRNGNHVLSGAVSSTASSSSSSSSAGVVGNYIDSGLQDSLGRVLVTETDNTGADPTYSYYDVTMPGGKTARYTVNYQQIPVTTSFNQKDPEGQAITEENNFMGGISSIVLPDGTAYKFSYDVGHYGELTSMTLPQGGKVSFSYATAAGGTDPSTGNLYVDHRYVTSHIGANGATSFTWAYQSSSPFAEQGASCPEVTNAVQTALFSGTYTFSNCFGSLLAKSITYGALGSSKPLVTQLFDYDLSHPCPTYKSFAACQGAIWRNLIGKTTVLAASTTPLLPATTTDIQYGYDNPATGAATSTKQWDYYAANPTALPDSPPGSPARETDEVYNYAVNFAQYPTQVTHKDGSGNIVSSTNYFYDEPAYFVPSSSSFPNHDDTLVSGNIGNLTTISQCCAIVNGQSTPVVSHYIYDNTGAVTGVIDPNQNQTTFSYDATDTFATSTTLPATGKISHVVHTAYDPGTGQVVGQQDQNGQGLAIDYDDIGRLSTQSFAMNSGSETLSSTTYPSPNETDVSSFQNATSAGTSSVITDGYGRTIHQVSGENTVDTVYDAQGNLYSVSNPHGSNPAPTDGTAQYTYDSLGRVLSYTSPKQEVTTYSYASNQETITDPLGHSRTYVQDAFGDLTSVTEPDTNGNMDRVSAYTYDSLSRLTRIDQKGNSTDPCQWRTRAFNYDGVGDLMGQTSPEQGGTGYSYDTGGNLLSYLTSSSPAQPCATPTIPTPSATSYSVAFAYDADNRLQSKQVSGAGSYTYTYDGNDGSKDPYGLGRLTGTTNGSGVQTLFSHDPAGRLASESYCMPSDCTFTYKTQATYDYQSNLTSLTYPDGRMMSWTYDTQNRMRSEQYAMWNADVIGVDAVTGVQYTPAGQVTQANYGGGATFYAAVYDPDLNIAADATADAKYPAIQRSYTWATNGTNLLSVQDAITGRLKSYTYDPLDRLQSMSDSGSAVAACSSTVPGVPASSETYSCDAWGNLQQSGTYNFVQSFDTNNRVSSGGYGYDGAGNQTGDGLGNTFQYRGDGLMSGSNSSTYTYDALGQRVRKDGSTANEYFFFGGELVATRDPSSGSWQDHLYGPIGELALIAGQENATAVFRASDHLGSLSGTYDPVSAALNFDNTLPFGQVNLNPTNDVYPFTGFERDAENQSDVAAYRHYASAQGRWLSPDPYNGSLNLLDPQSFNRYAYVGNRPMNSTDPSGLCDDSGEGCSDGGDGSDGGGNGDGSGNGSWDGGSSAFDGSLGGAYSDPTTGAEYADVYASSNSFLGASLTGAGGVWTSSQSFGNAVVSGFQFAVAIASNLPELGTVGNSINAVVSLARGNYKEAGLYSGAVVASTFGVPGAGAAVKVIQAAKAVAAAEEISQGTALIGEAAGAIGASGKVGEDALKLMGGESQVYFRTSQGGRYVDQLADGVANESKVGYASLSSGTSRQISKDVELINTRQIDGATWHFFKSPFTGLGGPSQPLLNALKQNGIGVVIK